MSGIGTCLWFDGRAEEAANFYVGLFPNSRIGEIARWGSEGPGVPGSALTVAFELDGRSFRGLNGGPEFTFNEAISFELYFDSQAELDAKWNALTADGGEESMCGWLKDKFGVSWQLVPTMMPGVLNGPDAEGSGRAMKAMMGMRKLVIAELQAAYDGQ
ncbi:3-demethylubiquinone-9 3-methyltransferase [Arthrobacter sp. PAMC 25486]|uniref:VOC family protein n=1 Tax=Arthrobacter sp. PAMC 25486 TaxID=1494608 RepID=UPI000535CB0F|nr:VOC family protein [Arthrobacter sp. PAMC 25486]AIY00143.1 3-demethylubiquinone-9 3-methyltransferase [Arthrobacter sp. PAMC 25486]